MGKHSAPQRARFYRSLAAYVARWLAVLALLGGVAYGLIRLLPREVPSLSASRGPSASPSPVPSIEPGEPGVVDSGSPSPSESAGTVQVLDGAGKLANVDAAIATLNRLGYRVLGPEATSRHYATTTVFYQPDERQLADAVAEAFHGAQVVAAPSSLDPSIPVTLVIGDDFQV
ncbi:MAG TPA: LytR C-terminal domain-containing protein [Actinomycetota bacterium]|nr:LytR C-terminal domain-containing protein [Actinomycetota bacterium]